MNWVRELGRPIVWQRAHDICWTGSGNWEILQCNWQDWIYDELSQGIRRLCHQFSKNLSILSLNEIFLRVQVVIFINLYSNNRTACQDGSITMGDTTLSCIDFAWVINKPSICNVHTTLQNSSLCTFMNSYFIFCIIFIDTLFFKYQYANIYLVQSTFHNLLYVFNDVCMYVFYSASVYNVWYNRSTLLIHIYIIIISHKTTANPHRFTCPIIHMLMVEVVLTYHN